MADKKLESFKCLEPVLPGDVVLVDGVSYTPPVCPRQHLKDFLPPRLLVEMPIDHLEMVKQGFDTLSNETAAARGNARSCADKSVEFIMANARLREILVEVRRSPRALAHLDDSLRRRLLQESEEATLAHVAAELTGATTVQEGVTNEVLGMGVSAVPAVPSVKLTNNYLVKNKEYIRRSIEGMASSGGNPAKVENLCCALVERLGRAAVRVDMEVRCRDSSAIMHLDASKIVQAVQRCLPAGTPVQLVFN